jgi:hypothetical protein
MKHKELKKDKRHTETQRHRHRHTRARAHIHTHTHTKAHTKDDGLEWLLAKLWKLKNCHFYVWAGIHGSYHSTEVCVVRRPVFVVLRSSENHFPWWDNALYQHLRFLCSERSVEAAEVNQTQYYQAPGLFYVDELCCLPKLFTSVSEQSFL